jgi:hypothetical protein
MDHIEYLSAFVPFGKASYRDIVTEMQDDITDAIETKALIKVKKMCRKGRGLIVLTGNAGHGKTFIAREILLDFQGKDRNSDEDKKLVMEQLNGDELKDPGIEHAGKKLAMHLDLSHTGSDAIAYLEKALKQADEKVTLVCVNEGRLRVLISEWEGDEKIRQRFEDGLEDCVRSGVASREDDLYFINLNYQSVVAGGRDSILESALKAWVDDDSKWSSRESSIDKEKCPIYRNRELLRITGDEESDEFPRKRRDGIAFLFRLAELYGHPTTIREMLQLLAYVLTGGKSCNEFKSMDTANPDGGWQSSFSFYSLIFGPDLAEDDLRQLPLVKKLKALDPAKGAWRLSDDNYIVADEDESHSGIDLNYRKTDKTIEDARLTMRGETKSETGSESGKEDAVDIGNAISILRRRDFFDLWSNPESDERERAKRLNVRHYLEFSRELERAVATDELTRSLLAKVTKGLNAVQGVFPWSSNNRRRAGKDLVLLHPAFIRLESQHQALNKTIKTSRITISSQPNAWREQENGLLRVEDTTDYLPTHLYFVLEANGDTYELSLSLERFSYLAKAAEGCFSKTFYAADIARIRSFLARLSYAFKDDEEPEDLTVIHDSGDYEYELEDEGRVSA